MSDYTICRDLNDNFAIVKWNDGDFPEAEYTVKKSKNGHRTCNCPSGKYRGYCKHTAMVKKWENMGEPIMMIISDI